MPTIADGAGADAVAPVLLLARQAKPAGGGADPSDARLAVQHCCATASPTTCAQSNPHLLAVAPVATMMLFARLTVSEPLTTNGRCCKSTDSTSSGSSWDPHRSACMTQCSHNLSIAFEALKDTRARICTVNTPAHLCCHALHQIWTCDAFWKACSAGSARSIAVVVQQRQMQHEAIPLAACCLLHTA